MLATIYDDKNNASGGATNTALAADTSASTSTAGVISTGAGVNATNEQDAQAASSANTKSYADDINNQYSAYVNQQTNNIDNQTAQSVAAKRKTYDDSISDYQKKYRDYTMSLYQGSDNKALESRANGEFGGVATQNVAATQSYYQAARQQIALQQQKLATDTVKDIENLRAQGEFDKADALLKARQQQFQALYEDAVRVDENKTANAQYQTTLDREDAATQRTQDQTKKSYLQQLGQSFLSIGSMPSEAMLAAMGLDKATAQLYINAVQAGY